MRCLALAQAWQDDGGHAVFVMAMESPVLEDRLKSEGMEVVHLSARPGSDGDAVQTADLARQMAAHWVVVDGYHFPTDYQRIIKDIGLCLLFIDDIGHAEHYYADIILNQNLHAHRELYPKREPYTQLLLGTHYVLLRREFLKWEEWKREIPDVARKVLVTLGGGDPDNVTLKVIRALQQVEVDGLEAVVVVGADNPHLEELSSAVHGSRLPIRLESNAKRMPDLITWAEAAVSSGGTTSWELAFMGLPSLILILADNQRPIAEQLNAERISMNLGYHDNLSPGEIAQAIMQLVVSARVRTEMARRGPEFVDGQGPVRVLMHVKGQTLRLRRVRQDDCRLLWEWANDPELRAVSFALEPIPWEQHVQWFKAKINDPYCVFYIGIDAEDVPTGQVRYDIDAKEAVVSVSVDRKFRGKGYGRTLISLSSQKVFDVPDVSVIHAYIKQNNEESVRAFVKAGFKKRGTTIIRGCQATHLILEKRKYHEEFH